MRVSALCALVCAAACGSPGVTKSDGGLVFTTPPTWNKHVLAITQKQCVNCHSTGGIGSFPLETYAQAKPFAAAMKAATSERRMPPWMPDPACGGPFRDERRLTQDEIDTLAAWADMGAVEGNPADAPPAPTPLGQLERVDSSVSMPEAYTPDRTLNDDYRCFLVDPKLTSSKQLVGYDISPGNRALVHHVILYLVEKADAEAADKLDAKAGWTCFGGPNIKSGGAVGAWAPGSPAVSFPAGTGISMAAGKVLAMQVHYNNAGGPGTDLTSVKLMYATTPVSGAMLLPTANDDFAIPPNAQNYTHAKNFKNPLKLPLKVWGLLPHMHTKGQRITMTATGSSGDTCLVDIPKWDFHWQQQYFRPTAYTFKADEEMRLSCTWTNPTSRTVTWGEGTDDEMCFAYVYVTF